MKETEPKIYDSKEYFIKREQLSLLLSAIRSDDRRAFEKIFKYYYARLVRFSLAFLNSREDAEDVVSIFFINLWQKRTSLKAVTYPENYLYSSVKNACLNYKRDHKKTMSLDEQQFEKSEPVYEQNAEVNELNKIIDIAVQALPEQRRIVFKLVKENGMKCREVANLLNLSLRTVESHLYKAVKTLADVVSMHLGYDPRKAGSGGNTRLMLLFI